MCRIIQALKWPITTVRQVWKDYQVGRAIRQRMFERDPKEDEDESPAACKEENNETCKEEHDENHNEERKKEEREEECSDPNENRCKDNEVPPQPATCSTGKKQERATEKRSGAGGRKWKFDREAEFPWRHEQVVDGESNWRGTWVLEVKDLRAMNWGVEEVPKMIGNRKGKKFMRKPTRQLPFPVGRERELLPSEGGQNNDLLSSDGGQDDLMVWLGQS
ncbi:hypothetical protein V8C43DRAFT_283793 [Trichoderma afarasin]